MAKKVQLIKPFSKYTLRNAVSYEVMFAYDEWMNPEEGSYADKHSTGEMDERAFDFIADRVVKAITKEVAPVSAPASPAPKKARGHR